MSLKGVHIVFIISAIIVTIIFGVWELQQYANIKQSGQLMTAVGSFILAAGLTVYGIWVAKKLKTDQRP